MLTPREILQTQFRTSLRGYNTKDVDAFMRKVVQSYEKLLKEHKALQDRVAELEEALREDERNAARRTELLRVAQENAFEITEKAQAQARETIAKAESEANEIVAKAQAQAGEILRSAQRNAEEIIAKARAEEQRAKERTERTEAYERQVRESLRALLERALKTLDDTERKTAGKPAALVVPEPAEEEEGVAGEAAVAEDAAGSA